MIERQKAVNAYRSEGNGRCKRFAENNCIMPEGGHSNEDRRELPSRIEESLKVISAADIQRQVRYLPQ